jgi:CubicO group peptidase (beta-lactamase class C family)
MRIRLLAVFLTVIFLPLSFGLAQTAASLDSIPARMRDVIVANEVPGAVTVVATRDSVLRMDAQGWADPEHKSFMRVDSIFWIASMSKPITATAVLMLMEEGKLSLDDPVAKYVPELAGLKTADGKTPRITLRHLLTHTSGMEEATDEEAKPARTLSDLVPAFASKPLAFEPGSKWKYCQSGILTLGRIVEIVSGVPFEVFLRKRIFDPLGMKDTTFYLSETQMPRWVDTRQARRRTAGAGGKRASVRPSSHLGRPLPGKQRWIVLNRPRLHALGPNAAEWRRVRWPALPHG